MKRGIVLLALSQVLVFSVWAQTIQLDVDAGIHMGVIEDSNTGWQISSHVTVTNTSSVDEDYWVSQEVLTRAGDTEFYFCWENEGYNAVILTPPFFNRFNMKSLSNMIPFDFVLKSSLIGISYLNDGRKKASNSGGNEREEDCDTGKVNSPLCSQVHL